MSEIVKKALLTKGKTDEVWTTNRGGVGIFISQNDITAGDGAKHDVAIGKAKLANQTTCNVFRFLNSCRLSTSFIEQIDSTSFLGKICKMVPYEVVVRRYAYGSYLKAYPHIPKDQVFPKLVVQYFLKTSGKRWQDIDLPVDDPLIIFKDDKALLFRPDQPIAGQEPFATLDSYPLKGSSYEWGFMTDTSTKTFLVLEKAWQQVGGKLIDFKVEFGIDKNDEICLADKINGDSWRVLDFDGNHLDKQLYREGSSADLVLEKYKIAAELTSRFQIPIQQLIIWTGSPKDSTGYIRDAIMEYGGLPLSDVKFVVLSMHKQPIESCNEIIRLVQNTPDSVVIASIGMSNGAGPTLSTQVSVPVITIPANYKDFPDDIWSSLRNPSNTPVMTILDVKNAVLASMQILAIKNPLIYMNLRSRQEERLSNNLIL